MSGLPLTPRQILASTAALLILVLTVVAVTHALEVLT